MANRKEKVLRRATERPVIRPARARNQSRPLDDDAAEPLRVVLDLAFACDRETPPNTWRAVSGESRRSAAFRYAIRMVKPPSMVNVSPVT